MSDSWYQLGRQFRSFLSGMSNAADAPVPAERERSPHEPVLPYGVESYTGVKSSGAREDDADIAENNPGARLRGGCLLITHQPTKSAYQVDPVSREIEYLFTLARKEHLFVWRAIVDDDGRIYFSYSGVIVGEEPIRFARFGHSGGILSLDYRRFQPSYPYRPDTRLLYRGVDPLGLEFIGNDRLLITDFNGFGGVGSISLLDRMTGTVEMTWRGTELVDPIKALMDADGSVWVANADQTGQDGEVLRITPDGHREIVFRRQGAGIGALVDLLVVDADHLVVVRDSLPALETSAVLLFDKKKRTAHPILSGARGAPRFYTQGHVVDGILWIGESYQKKILKVDLKKEKVVDEIDMSALMGGVRGVQSSYDVIESVYVIPQGVS